MAQTLHESHVSSSWPLHVPPPGAAGWQRHALNWLLDLCPADYRAHPVLLRQPLLLAHLARMHVLAQIKASEQARNTLRTRLAGRMDPEAVEEGMAAVCAEGERLAQALRSVDAVGQAMAKSYS